MDKGQNPQVDPRLGGHLDQGPILGARAAATAEQTPTALPRAAAVHIIDPVDMEFCSFWLGMFRQGKLEPQDLFGEKANLFGALERAAVKGMSEKDPVMVSDTSVQPPRFLYMMPTPTGDFRERLQWVAKIVDTVKSWAPDRIGIYLAPELVKPLEARDLLHQLLRGLIAETPARDYFLIPGGHGFNAVLNAALELKAELLDEHNISMFVFH